MPRSLLCNAPWASLYMDPRGEVKVCCQNEWLRLGNVGETSLHDIWNGDQLARLRERMTSGDLSLGCEMCQVAVDRGSAESAYFNSFAHLEVDPDRSEWPLQLELALSNTCNLQCIMCNGELSSAIRSRREGRPALVSPYGERFFEDLDDFLPHLRSLTFLGGEPFLARESLRVMERLVERGLTPHCSVTTNGTQWNDRIERLVQSLPMHVATSVDGTTAATVESVRIGVDHSVLERNVGRFHRALQRSGGSLGFSYCMMLPTWSELGGFLRWADELDVDVYVNAVHHPPHLSFAHCDLVELERVVSALHEESDRHEQQLWRNLHVWRDQVASVTALYRQRLGENAPPMTGDSEPVATPVTLRPTVAAVPVSVIRADGRQIVTDVDAADAPAFGVDLQRLVGQSLWETVRLISGSLGELESSDVLRTESGIEQRHLVFSNAERTTVVTATMQIRPDGGPTWTLTFAGDSVKAVSTPN